MNRLGVVKSQLSCCVERFMKNGVQWKENLPWIKTCPSLHIWGLCDSNRFLVNLPFLWWTLLRISIHHIKVLLFRMEKHSYPWRSIYHNFSSGFQTELLGDRFLYLTKQMIRLEISPYWLKWSRLRPCTYQHHSIPSNKCSSWVLFWSVLCPCRV